MKPSRARRFRTAVALGFVLGGLLLGHTLYTFRYVVRELVLDHVAGLAVRQISELENAARVANAEDPAPLAVEVEAFREASADLIDSIRIVDQDGRPARTAQPDTGRVRTPGCGGGRPSGCVPCAESARRSSRRGRRTTP